MPIPYIKFHNPKLIKNCLCLLFLFHYNQIRAKYLSTDKSDVYSRFYGLFLCTEMFLLRAFQDMNIFLCLVILL